METRSVKFREWSAWACTVLALIGINSSMLRDWVRMALPSLSWLVASLSVPWLGIVFGALIVASASYLVGVKVATARLAALPDEIEIPAWVSPLTKPSFVPDEAHCYVLRALRWHDEIVPRADIMSFIMKKHGGASVTEINLAVDDLYRRGWIAGGRVSTAAGRQMAYQLADEGMKYAKAQDFPHRRQSI